MEQLRRRWKRRMKQHKHLSEEQLIDIVLGNLPENEHIKNCEHCQAKIDRWSQILRHEIKESPSEHLKGNIWAEFEKAKKPKRKIPRKSILIYSFGTIAAIFVIAIGLIFYKSSLVPSYEVTFNDEIDKHIQHEAETKQVAVIPVADFPEISGNLWINDHTNELLLEVDGLENLVNNDYQLWIIYDEDQMDGEILSIQDGTSRVFMKSDHVGSLELLKGSLEPLGGSSEPTGPEMFVVPLGYLE